MQKREWVYHGRFKQHLVEVLHNANAEKALIRLNGAVLFDEIVPKGKNKTFHFFIDEEFCELQLQAQNNEQYAYQFITHEFSTSKFGKQQKWRDRWQKIGIGSAVILLMLFIIVPISYYTWQQQQTHSNFKAGGISTPAQIVRLEAQVRNSPPDSLPRVRTRLYYTYSHQQRSYTGETTQWLHYRNDTLFTPAGLPLLKNDHFETLIAPQNPVQSQLRLDHPTDEQLGYYWLMARQKCNQNSDILPPSTPKELYCDCLLHKLVNQYDLAAFAYFYHQFEPIAPRWQYHRNSYAQWIGQRQIRILQNNCAAEPMQQ